MERNMLCTQRCWSVLISPLWGSVCIVLPFPHPNQSAPACPDNTVLKHTGSSTARLELLEAVCEGKSMLQHRETGGDGQTLPDPTEQLRGRCSPRARTPWPLQQGSVRRRESRQGQKLQRLQTRAAAAPPSRRAAALLRGRSTARLLLPASAGTRTTTTARGRRDSPVERSPAPRSRPLRRRHRVSLPLSSPRLSRAAPGRRVPGAAADPSPGGAGSQRPPPRHRAAQRAEPVPLPALPEGPPAARAASPWARRLAATRFP